MERETWSGKLVEVVNLLFTAGNVKSPDKEKVVMT